MVFKTMQLVEITKETGADRKQVQGLSLGVSQYWGDDGEPAIDGKEKPVEKKKTQWKPHERSVSGLTADSADQSCEMTMDN